MAYKFKSFVTSGSNFLVKEIRDFMVACGWTDITPSGQDDQDGVILGYWLKSTGETGEADKNDLFVHIGAMSSVRSQTFVEISYLSGAMTASQDYVPVVDTTVFTSPTGSVKVGSEWITYSGVDGGLNRLTGCVRGYGLTDPATHSANDVVSQLGNAAIEIFANVDLTNYLAVSGAPIAWSLGTKAVTGITGLNTFGDDYFNFHSLIRATGGTQSGKMRWVKDYATAGDFTYQAFLTAPGAVACEVISGGFFPSWSKRSSESTGNGYYRAIGSLSIGGASAAGTPVWFYGSKDGIAIVQKYSTDYYFNFWGKPIVGSSPIVVLTTLDAAAAQNRIRVANLDPFAVNGKYRIIGRDILDWRTNRVQGGSWPNLDPEEGVSEEFVVTSIDVGNSELVLSSNLRNSYETGAVVGEDPRPMIRWQSGSSAYPLENAIWGGLFLPCNPALFGSHASNRQRWRAFHVSGDKYTPTANTTSTNACYKVDAGTTQPCSPNYLITDAQNRQNEALPLTLLPMSKADQNEGYAGYGCFNRFSGWLPFVWESQDKPPFNVASAEDTVKGVWNGKMETFRIFYVNVGTYWIVCGPEIPIV